MNPLVQGNKRNDENRNYTVEFKQASVPETAVANTLYDDTDQGGEAQLLYRLDFELDVKP